MHWITPDWPAPKHIHAATTLRSGGISLAEFSSLNLADHVNDKLQHVLTNRLYISKMLKLPAEPVWLRQTHGTLAVCADQVKGCPEADASYSAKTNIVCSVLTADCLPVLLCAQQGSTVAAIHAGWRGLLNGIIENTVLNMPDKEILAWLGPAIGPQCFEVGAEVRDAFISKSREFSSAFTVLTEDKYLADIYHIARIRLNALGIHHIYGGDFCTVSDQQRFFSYRRDGQTGRMASLIWKE